MLLTNIAGEYPEHLRTVVEHMLNDQGLETVDAETLELPTLSDDGVAIDWQRVNKFLGMLDMNRSKRSALVTKKKWTPSHYAMVKRVTMLIRHWTSSSCTSVHDCKLRRRALRRLVVQSRTLPRRAK